MNTENESRQLCIEINEGRDTEREARKGDFHLVYGEVRAHITSLSLPPTLSLSLLYSRIYMP